MGNLLTSLLNSANAMNVFDRQLIVIQNNVTNASTPGYVRQSQDLVALPFQLDTGQTGGVASGKVISARSEYAEDGVRRQQSLLGEAGQKAADLAQIETLFSLSSKDGVAGSLNKLFQSFSQLSVNPNDPVARQTVIDRAGDVAQSFNQTSLGLSGAAQNAGRQLSDTVDTVNRLAGEIRDINAVRAQSYQTASDAGLDAKLHSTLEELSQYASFAALPQADGSVNIYLGGQTALVTGQHQHLIQADSAGPATRILDSGGDDVTGQMQSGKLGALLQEKNQIIPSYLADLNTLARAVADGVNAQLQSGVDASGATPPVDLFTYNATVGEAASLAVSQITPSQIAAAAPSAPGGNSNALDLAALVDSKLINGFTATQFFGNLGGRAGRDLANAKDDQQSQTSMVTQARSLRDQASGVSIDEEAAHLVQVQRAYQASAKLLTVLNDLTSTVINIIR